MSKNHRTKNYTLTKLYKILDNNSKKDLNAGNQKYLGSLSHRLKEISGEEIILRKKVSQENLDVGDDSLNPKVIIHAREVKKEIEPLKVKIEEKKRIDFRDEDIFEIKKIKIREPEFIEVKPKTISKEEIIEIKDLKSEEEKLPIWDSEEVKKEETLEELPELEPVSQEEVKKSEPEPIDKIEVKKEEKKELEDRVKFCPKCGIKLSIETDICTKCGSDIKFETTTSFIPIKMVEKEYIPLEWEPIEIEKPEEKKIPIIKKEEKIIVFKNLKSVDEDTAVLLYDNGITSIDLLKEASKKDLTKIKGMKRKTVKRIIKDLKKFISESEKEKPVEIEVFEKEEFIEEKLPIDSGAEEKTEEWSSPEEFISETTVWEPIEKDLKEKEEKETPIFEELTTEKEIEEPIIDTKSKIEVFKDIKSIDSKTAVLLFDNGYTNADTLIKVPIKDLIKIKGIKRKTAKKIKKELEKTISAPIIEVEEKIKTDNFLKIEEELETTKKELKSITKDFKKKEKNIQKLQKELEDKTIDLESQKTELYNRDEEIKHLEKQSDQKKQELETGKLELNKKQEEIDQLHKELEEKRLGLESKNVELTNKDEEIKKLQNLLEQNKKDLKSGDVELNKRGEKIERIKKDLITKTSELDKKQQTIKELQSELTKTQKELEIKYKEIKIKTFKDIHSIHEQTAILLYDNGITTIEALKSATKKNLLKIKGIKRKTVKNIINEIEQKSDKELYHDIKKDVEERPIEKTSDKKEITKELKKKERPTEYYSDENEITKDEAMEIDKKIADEFSLIVRDDDVFKDINCIDEKISILLRENGISTIEALKNATIKDLTRIRGIKRKVAKKIKKEISNLPEIVKDIKSERKFEQEEVPSADEEELEWEYYDEHLISNSTMKEYKGFRHEDYTLYKKEIETKSGKKRIVRFFSKAEPDNAEPIELPKGYVVKKNKKTGLPYLRKKK